jgi:replicative superfamily II helicase
MLSVQTMTVSVAIAGAVIAYAAYRRFTKAGHYDLRGEVCAERESLRSVIEALPAQLERAGVVADESTSPLRSDSMRQRLSELEVDLLEAKLLGSELPDIDYTDLSAAELELRLVEILAMSVRANALADKYRALSADITDSVDNADAAEFSQQRRMSLVAPS